ncbi:MAG TPA: protein kinase, partial [Thermoanaerobaculia bacterium]|nr:protein kinase [Thermoanaerobaculia bacterium]
NVLLPAAGGAVLADWGLARRWDAVVADDVHDSGLDYVSPEQALGKELDERSDLYSFGAILFEMLTGRPPFEASRPIGLLRAHLRDRPPDVRLLDAKIPAWLAGVTARLLEKDPEARYASAADALVDLGAHHARRAARKRVRRSLLVAAEAILALGLASAWFRYRERAFDSVHLLVDAGKRSLEVLDGRGRSLWSARGVANASDVALLRRGGSDWAVVTPGERDGTLTLNDARTGSVLARVSLPGASPSGLAQVRAVDLEGRGTDVLLGAYHDREGTWSIAVHDAETRVSRRVLVSSAPHAFAGAADLDGDGRREILLAGAMPAFGHTLGVAACRVPLAGADGPALTPDLGEGSDALLWYALVPQPDPSRPNLELDAERRLVTLELGGGLRRHLEAGGFLREDRSDLAPAERAAHRARSYGLLRRTTASADAISLTREALAEARRASDATLAESTERAHAIALVRAGRGEEGARLLNDLAGRARAPAEIALDAARAFHAAGARADAIAWYRDGLARAAGPGARAGSELARGLVDVYGELGRWDEALRDLDRAEAQHPALALDTFALRQEVAAKAARR